MSAVKLTADSAQPAAVAGRVQLFGSDYNPYSQQVHMVLIAKDIPHDVFEVDLRSKPAWLASLQTDERRPVLLAEGKALSSDEDILKYLADKYPNRVGQDPALREASMALLGKFEAVKENFRSALKDKDFKPSEKGREFFKAFEEELTKRGTTFLGGESPSTGDCLIWPWFERFRVPFLLHGQDYKPPADRAPGKITAWREAMEKTKPVTQTRHTVEEHVEAFKNFFQK